jgi:hypothetical protein
VTDLCFALVVVAGAAPRAGVSAQVGAVPRDSSPVFPATAIGGLGRGLIEAINTGDSAAQAAFVAAHVSQEALEAVPLADRVAWLTRVAEQSGGLQVLEAKGGEPLEVLVKTRLGDHWARIWAFADPRLPEKLGDYGAVPMRDPAVEQSDVWPSRRLLEAAMLDEIGRRLARAAERDEFSGVVLVAKGGRTILHRAYGLADRSWRVPNQVNTKFNLASMNKMFTAIAIAQLVERGRLRLDDTLAALLPDYPNPNAARRITVAHLLSHSAGLGMLFDRPGSIAGSATAPRATTSPCSPPSRCISSPAPLRPTATRVMWCSAPSWSGSRG